MKSFLELTRQEQAELIQTASFEMGFSPLVLEKDVWICWALQQLFTLPARLKMVFKGGTSLSKVFRAISRFSEDLDITIDLKDWNLTKNPLDPSVSNTQRKAIGNQIKDLVKTHVHEVVHPHIKSVFHQNFGQSGRVEVSEDGEQVRLFYPTVLQEGASYIANTVLIEFGGRNVTEPSELHSIKPYLAEVTRDVEFPTAQAAVLSPARTFWEKATLIHVECHRETFRNSAERLSRHWYDLAVLFASEIGKKAISEKDLLLSVLEVKKTFYNSAYAHYDECLTGNFRLVPPEPLLADLKSDYLQMVDAGMIYDEPLKFEEITKRLKELEALINKGP